MEEKVYQLSEVQEVLIDLLRDSEVPLTDAIGVMLMLKDKEELMAEMAIWIYDNHPTEQEVMEWFGMMLRREGVIREP